jgi:cell division protein ZapA (FtsZ GTPase activity inhibitor)
VHHLAGSDRSTESCVRKIGSNIFRTVRVAATTIIDVAAGSSDEQNHSPLSQMKKIERSPIQATLNVADCLLETAAYKKPTGQEVKEKIRQEYPEKQRKEYEALEA